MSQREYIDAAVAASMLRQSLKRNFPGIKFSVRTSKYAGGASIRVGWNDGPSSAMVDEIAQRFAGASFDGMIDLESPVDSILCDEQGDIRHVNFGSKYVFCQRETKPGLREACEAEYGKTCVVRDHQDENSRDHWIMKALSTLTIPADEAVEATAVRVVRAIFSPSEGGSR